MVGVALRVVPVILKPDVELNSGAKAGPEAELGSAGAAVSGWSIALVGGR